MSDLDISGCLRDYYYNYCKANDLTPDKGILKSFMAQAQERIEELSFGGFPMEDILDDYIADEAVLDLKNIYKVRT